MLEDQEINDDPTNYPLGLVLSKTIPNVVRVAFFCFCRFGTKKLTLFCVIDVSHDEAVSGEIFG